MARDPEKDILKNPTPAAGTKKKTADGVLTALKIGNSAVSLLAGLLAAVLILYSGYVLYDSFSTEYQAYSSAWDLLKYKPAAMREEPSGGAETLEEINQDYRAWLTIYDTTIDYPVVQGEDDLYYALHDIYRNTSLTGAIYQAAANHGDFSDSYNVIYGHHLDNGAMFGSLDRFKDEYHFKTHQGGLLVSKSGIYDITLFAAASTDAYESRIYMVGDRAADVISFLTGDRSQDAGVGTNVLVYDEQAAKGAEHIVALSTCADAETYGRLVVFGKLTPHKEAEPTEAPTDAPTDTPTAAPTDAPTDAPTAAPTDAPTDTPTAAPTDAPTDPPTAAPTDAPTDAPTAAPTDAPTDTPTAAPTDAPTAAPTAAPTDAPTDAPTTAPTDPPTAAPTDKPTEKPTIAPPEKPTAEPTPTQTPAAEVKPTPTLNPGPYSLQIRYEYLDGSAAAPTFYGEYMAGDYYELENPEIKGYMTARRVVQGTMEHSDAVVVVLYVPVEIAEKGRTISIDDYEVPLGLENLYAQMGVCVE